MSDLFKIPTSGLRWTPPEQSCADCAAGKTMFLVDGACCDLTIHTPDCPTGQSLLMQSIANSKD